MTDQSQSIREFLTSGLLQLFFTENSARLSRAGTALAARDYDGFRSHIHAMKGSAAILGTSRLTRLCAELEQLTDAELGERGPTLLRMLTDECFGAHSELKKLYLQNEIPIKR
jgi:HPt (histidine-containing phosphotransfer) domain-containing protein